MHNLPDITNLDTHPECNCCHYTADLAVRFDKCGQDSVLGVTVGVLHEHVDDFISGYMLLAIPETILKALPQFVVDFPDVLSVVELRRTQYTIHVASSLYTPINEVNNDKTNKLINHQGI